MSRLNPTSYAILGQIALAPGSAYELTKRMRRNYRFFWPRAESRLYQEARRLVELGLARSKRGFTGQRERTTYQLTKGGRAALGAWLAEPPSARWTWQFEPLLRVFLANFGTREQLLIAITRAQEAAEELLTVARVVAEDYAEGTAEGQPHVHVRALVFDLLVHQALAVRDWSMRARREVQRWEDVTPDGKSQRALSRIRTLAREHL
jgi:PadR family transcriptional regulator, regulatory protein AphA